MKFSKKDTKGMAVGVLAGLTFLLALTRCGSDSASTVFTQVERLARPGINEALVITPAYLSAFNSIPPTADLTSAATPVVNEVVQVLTALYAGSCFLGLSPLVACPATGGAVLSGGQLTAAMKTAAGQYATKVAGHFLPDVMRIDTALTSTYFSGPVLCNALADGSPLLCGGRKPEDDVIDITFAYLLNSGTSVAAIQDGVSYAGSNIAQGHTLITYAAADFPYIPAPY